MNANQPTFLRLTMKNIKAAFEPYYKDSSSEFAALLKG